MTITPNKTETNFILSKCKVTPLKRLNVLKLALDAAIIGIRLLKTVQKKTTLRIHDTHFWTDKRVVLDWIASKKKKKLFVASRLREIHESSKPSQWHYISTKQNPAVHGTFGLEPELSSKWLQAPSLFPRRQYTNSDSAHSKITFSSHNNVYILTNWTKH